MLVDTTNVSLAYFYLFGYVTAVATAVELQRFTADVITSQENNYTKYEDLDCAIYCQN